jgi:hypothetical protein
MDGVILAGQVSAVQKIVRSMRIQDGLMLYRGLGGTISFPRRFFKPDESGRKGYTEWGFMSTTADPGMAIKYSGVREGRQLPLVMVIRTSAVDRGACIRFQKAINFH